jgi:hypothetical protein
MAGLRLACMVVAACMASGLAAQITWSNTQNPIPDNGPGVLNEIAVSVSNPGPSMRVTINIDHTSVGDLDIFLLAPGSNWPGGVPTVATEAAAIANGVVELTTGNGGSGDNYTSTQFVFPGDNLFDLLANTPPIATMTAPATGTWVPEGWGHFGAAATFSGRNGGWRLAVIDRVAGGTGTLVSWAIEFGHPSFGDCFVGPGIGGDLFQFRNGSTYALAASRPAGVPLQLSLRVIAKSNTAFPGSTPASTNSMSNCTAVVTSQPQSPLSYPGTATIDLSLTPLAAGTFSFILQLDSLDTNENPFLLTVQGQATASALPEITVFAGVSSAPILIDGGVDVHEPLIAATATVIDYVVLNDGFANLVINGSPKVAVSAASNCTAQVTLQPTSPVTATQTTGFEIAVTPTVPGAWSFQWSMANNDANEGPFNVTVSGMAQATGPEISVHSGSDIVDGGTDVLWPSTAGVLCYRELTIENFGDSNLDFIGSPSFTITGMTNCTATPYQPWYTPVAPAGFVRCGLDIFPLSAGAWSVSWSLASNDADENPFNATTTGNAQGPGIQVSRGAVAIADGSTDNIGTGFVVAAPTTLTYTFSNTGTTTLTLTNPANISGQVNCNVTITLPPNGTIPASGSTPTNISVTPLVAGNFSFTYSIDNNDPGPGKNPYNWTVSGATQTPDMNVVRSTTTVLDGSTDAVGAAFVAGVPGNLSYTLENVGTGPLSLTSPGSVTVMMNCVVNILTAPAASVAPGLSTALVLEVTVATPGSFSFNYSINNNDLFKNPYNWTISGTATAAPAPEMDVFRGSSPISASGTDLAGSAFVAGVGSTLTYTIANTGTADLNISTLPVAAPSSLVNCTATITTQPTSPIPAASSVAFAIEITPIAPGAFSCTVSIDSDDGNENPYNWTIAGNSAPPPAPEIEVTRGSVPVADGGLDSPGAAPAGSVITLTYTISNPGSAALNLSGIPAVALTGLSNCTAVVTLQPAITTLAPSTSTTFEVQVTPLAVGAFSFGLSIANNDANENPYDWTVSGTASSSGGGSGSRAGDAGGGCSTEERSAPIILLMAGLGLLLLLVGTRKRFFRRC